MTSPGNLRLLDSKCYIENQSFVVGLLSIRLLADYLHMPKVHGKIDRSQDKRVYQPRIHADLIHELYLLKLRTGLPMTVLVEMAILLLLDQHRADDGKTKTNNS